MCAVFTRCFPQTCSEIKKCVTSIQDQKKKKKRGSKIQSDSGLKKKQTGDICGFTREEGEKVSSVMRDRGVSKDEG